MAYDERISLNCVPPFSLELTAFLFSDDDPQIRRIQEGRFWQVIRLNNQLVLATVTSSGTIESPRVSAELTSNRRISNKQKRQAETALTRLLDTQLDLKPFYQQASKDEVLERVTHNLKGLRIPSTPNVFEALIDSIVEQQISLNIAHAFETSLIKAYGDVLRIRDETYYAYPTPENLASATAKKLRECGLSTKKSEYITDISRLIVHKKLDLESFKEYRDVGKIVRELDQIRGIGLWTAELTIARSMHKYDVIPADDIGLRRVIAHQYRKNRKITAQEVRTIAKKWGRWKGLAAFYLIVAEAKDEASKASGRRT